MNGIRKIRDYIFLRHSTDELVTGLLAATKTGEHLYLLPLSFAVDSFLVSAEQFLSSWITLQELEEVRQQLPETWNTVESWNTPENLFSLVSPFLLGSCVDWSGYSCSFDSPETQDVLNWCKTWGRDEAMDDRDEKVILRYKQIAALSSLVGLRQQTQNWFDGADYRYVGIPGIDSSASAYGITAALGISRQCEQAELAVVFLQYVLVIITLTVCVKNILVEKVSPQNTIVASQIPSATLPDDCDYFQDLVPGWHLTQAEEPASQNTNYADSQMRRASISCADNQFPGRYSVKNAYVSQLQEVFYEIEYKKVPTFPESIEFFTVCFGKDHFSLDGTDSSKVCALLNGQTYTGDLTAEAMLTVYAIIEETLQQEP